MTYWQQILHDLRSTDGWFCGSWWYAKAMPTFAQRISIDLRPRGYVIESRVCQDHDHSSTVHQYRLLREPGPEQRALIAI